MDIIINITTYIMYKFTRNKEKHKKMLQSIIYLNKYYKVLITRKTITKYYLLNC